MIKFNVPYISNHEISDFEKLMQNRHFCGDGEFTRMCSELLEVKTSSKVLLTTSCTHALELTALILGIKEGDEVIMPSYTFVSTANAFALRGAKIVFVDIRKDTLNIDENKIEEAITKKTKIIVPVHYAGVACEMDTIMSIADKYNLFVVEDAAQAINATYKNKQLGTIGHFGCYSFHETKNIHCGEGGALLINDSEFIERAEIIREKGTNRTRFLRGQIDKYSWVDIGSSYLISELNAAFLCSHLKDINMVTDKRLKHWRMYYDRLKPLEDDGYIELPVIPNNTTHNAHMFYIKLKNIEQRQELIQFLAHNGIQSVFHYIPLHNSRAGLELGVFKGKDEFTTKESERLLRLPLYYELKTDDIDIIVNKIYLFLNN